MKKAKTILEICAIVVIIALIVGIVFFTKTSENDPSAHLDPTPEIDHADVKIVFLGDSIAEGILGPSPVAERERYSYPSMVGLINGFTYRNRAVSGHKSYQLRDYLSAEGDENGFTHISHVKTADIISISILGNDLLQSSFNKQMRDALDGNFDEVDAILADSYNNIDAIVKRIRELNPDVTLIMQTVYNPVYSTSFLMEEKTIDYMIQKGYQRSDMHVVAKILIDRMNNVLFRYLENHPNAFYLIDVNKRFEEIYDGVDEKLDRLIYRDCIHPSNEGHATIAALLQEKLEELGLAEHDYAIENYKTLCIDRLKDLYTDTEVAINRTAKKIKKAKSYTEVNKVYYDAVDQVIPKYQMIGTIEETGEEEEYDVYRLTSASVFQMDVKGFIDMEESYIKIQKKGGNKVIVRLQLSESAMAAVKLIIGNLTTEFDISIVEKYILEFFPTESLEDLTSLHQRMKDDLGIGFDGLSWEDEGTKRILDSIEANKTLPPKSVFPPWIAVLLTGSYEEKTIQSETGEDVHAAYFGRYTKNGETYLVLTFTEDEDGTKRVLFHNDPLMVDVWATLEEPQQ